MDPIGGGFVGREAELARIDAAAASVANGRSALVWLDTAWAATPPPPTTPTTTTTSTSRPTTNR